MSDLKHENQAFFETVLLKLDHLGVLKDLVLIGSWSIYFYQSYFDNDEFSALRTQDMDFLIPTPPEFSVNIDLIEELEEMGFVLDLHRKGFMKLSHPKLTVDFLVPQKGEYTDKPFKIKSLKINVQSLPFMDMLLKDTVCITKNKFTVTVPHPLRLCFHKLLISQRRQNLAKKKKDIKQAHEVLKVSLKKYSIEEVKVIWSTLNSKWQKIILSVLENENLKNLLLESRHS